MTTWTAACKASLSITNSLNLLKLMSIESAMASTHIVLCHSLLFLPSIFPSIRVFSNESVLCIRWPKYWSFSFSISSSRNIQDWFPLGWTSWISLQSKGLSRVFSNTAVQKHQTRVCLWWIHFDIWQNQYNIVKFKNKIKFKKKRIHRRTVQKRSSRPR